MVLHVPKMDVLEVTDHGDLSVYCGGVYTPLENDMYQRNRGERVFLYTRARQLLEMENAPLEGTTGVAYDNLNDPQKMAALEDFRQTFGKDALQVALGMIEAHWESLGGGSIFRTFVNEMKKHNLIR